ncbi:VacJ family lipoprotein [Polaromonas sp.]|uniref:MlaA family lipoprotein n=1 Tax=Polaromonas sp. TaxID=1869339 RepID=UPI00286C4B2B|nr:VacJ family lipoprotein [Polaromonas sp.]
MKSSLLLTAAGLVLVLLQGCATGPNANPADPLEPFNRVMFNFNDGVDRAVLKPVATAYRTVTPSPVRTGVTNFFGNISDVWSLVNNVLQLKPKESVETLMRVSMNTWLGLGGLIDIASEMRLEKHKEDFGQTLGYWGVKTGPYVVLPLLGPSTVRDSVGSLVDSYGDLVTQIDKTSVRNSLVILRVVDKRARFLNAGDVLEDAALDKYTFTRDIYLQRRSSLVGVEPPAREERYDLPEVTPGAPAEPPAPPQSEPSPVPPAAPAN